MRPLLARALGAGFALAGISKLTGWLPPLERFYQWQLPGWWMVYVVGLVQLAGGIGLWSAGWRRRSALVLAATTLIQLSAQVRLAYWWDALLSLALIVLLMGVAGRLSRDTLGRAPEA